MIFAGKGGEVYCDPPQWATHHTVHMPKVRKLMGLWTLFILVDTILVHNLSVGNIPLDNISVDKIRVYNIYVDTRRVDMYVLIIYLW